MSRKIIDYFLLGDPDPYQFNTKVRQFMAEGWEVYGPPFACVVFSCVELFQAMVKYSGKDSSPLGVEYLNLNEVMSMVDVSRSGLYRWIEEGNFPKPFRMGARRVKWRKEDIMIWLHNRKSK